MEMSEGLKKLTAAALSSAAEEMGYATGRTTENDLPDIVSDLVATMETIRSWPAIATAIWFIDRDREYASLISNPMILGREEDAVRALNGAIPIHHWHMGDLEAEIEHIIENKEDKPVAYRMLTEGKLFPFRQPGIWVEMNKGPHKRLDHD